MTPRIVLAVLTIAVASSTGCSAPVTDKERYLDTGTGSAGDRVTKNGSLPPTPTAEIPQELLPAPGVVLIGDAELDEAVANGEAVINLNQVATDNAVRANETEQVIEQAAQANPKEAPVIKAQTEGVISHTLADGREVLLLNDYARKEILRGALEADGAAADYAVIYDAAPADAKASLEAPASATVDKNVVKTAAALVNIKLAVQVQAVQAKPDIPTGYTDVWESEQGTGFNGDHSGRRAACGGFSAKGIYKNFDFPLKYRLTTVKDQGNRGTCGSFAITSVAESYVANNQNKWVNLSEQDLYFHIRGPWVANIGFYGDGTNLALALPTMLITGYRFGFEKDWDYNASNMRTENPLKKSCNGYAGELCSDTYHQGKERCSLWQFWNCLLPEGAKIAGRTNVHVNGGRVLGLPVLGFSIDAMKAAVNSRQGVVLSFDVTPKFDGPKDGFVTYAQNETRRGGHVVHLVGYVSNEDLFKTLPAAPPGSGGGYFIVKNSWGECWADGGFVYVPVDFIKEYGTGVIVINSVGS